jgi:hypothetical protein
MSADQVSWNDSSNEFYHAIYHTTDAVYQV